MSPPAEGQPSGDASPTPVDGGTLLPPSVPTEGTQVALQGLTSADSSLIADTSHVQQLINHGADVNAPDNNGWTPLHTAAYHGQEEIVRILLAANANVNARNKTEETPLHLAAKWPQDRVVEALLSGGADLTARNKRGRTPAHVASLFNRHAILDRLLSAGADVNAVDSEQQTPLHLAVRPSCPVEPELVKTLIRHNADLECVDARGNTPLHCLPSAQVGDWLHWAAYEGKEGLMQVLLAKPGVRPDWYSEEGLTPLHLAAHVNSTNMVTMLLNVGAKVNAPSQPPTKPSGKDSTYGIPLPGAPGSITAGISISSQLKAYGSSKLPPGELTALHIAAERGSAELIRVLVAAGSKVNVQGERGMPPLHVAVWEGNTAAVAALLAAKASVSLKSKAGGFTSVHCACLSSRATPELLALLLDNGGAVLIEERCQEGWTALHLACQSAPPAMVELLLQRGARPTAKGKNGRMAADCATKRPEILQLLHVATGGKVPLPLGLPSVAAAAAANGLMTHNGSLANGSGSANGAARGGAGSRSGRAGGGGSGRAGGGGSSQAGLLPGTAAVLEPLESVEATLAALLADMGGALCSLQAGAVFGAGACAVDPVGHCIRPLDKRLVVVCTLGCHFSFHLQCWKSAREVLKERWAGFSGALVAGGRYCCIAPGCPGYIREQAICDGAQMQASNQSRLYLMAQDVYDSLPTQAKPIGGGVPLPPGAGDGCLGIGVMQPPATPLQPALLAGGGLSSLAALAPSLTLAQAMVQAATAVGNMVGGSGRMGSSQLAAALAASGGLPALLANPPPVPTAMSAREAAAIAAQTLGVGLAGMGGGGGCSSCVVEELGSGDEYDDEDGAAAASGATTGRGGGGGSGASTAASRSSGAASTSSSGGAATNGGSGLRKQAGSSSGGGGGGGSSSRRGAKGSGGKALGGKSSAAPPISSAAAAEMLQQLQGLQQAVAAVQSAVGAGVHSMGLSMAGGPQANGDVGSGATGAAAAAGPPSSAPAARAPPDQPVLEPLRDVMPPRELVATGLSSGSGDDGDGWCEPSSSGGSSGALHDVAPMPPPRRRNPPMPAMSRRLPPPPLTGAASENGRQPVSPQLATPPPATSLLTPGVQQLLSPAVAGVGPAATPPLAIRQPDASLAPILVGPVSQMSPPNATTGAAEQQSARAAVSSQAGIELRASADTSMASGGATGVDTIEHRPPLPVATSAAAGGGSESKASSAGGARNSPRRSGSISTTKAELKAVLANCQPMTGYGGRVGITPSGLSIGIVRGVPLAAVVAASSGGGGGGQQALSGLTVTRTLAGKAAAVQPGTMQQNAGSYEPGGYARAVCPGLIAGVHRVTHSSGRVPAPPPPPQAEASGAGTGGAGDGDGEGGGDGSGADKGLASSAAAPTIAPAAAAVDSAEAPTQAQETDPRGTAAAPAGPRLDLAAANAGEAPAAARSPPAAAAAAAATATAETHDANGASDIVLEALHGLRQPTAAAESRTEAAAGSSAAAPHSRHLLLESGDIPLLAGTPGMLEAWLCAHVGGLATYRILAPQSAVAVSLESDAAAAAAAASLRCRSNLLVQPLTVAPLTVFPEDEVLAASAQQVARAGCSRGERTWMRRMVQLWERLQDLPPVINLSP